MTFTASTPVLLFPVPVKSGGNEVHPRLRWESNTPFYPSQYDTIYFSYMHYVNAYIRQRTCRASSVAPKICRLAKLTRKFIKLVFIKLEFVNLVVQFESN